VGGYRAEKHRFGRDVGTIPPVPGAQGLSAAPIVLTPDDLTQIGATAMQARMGFVPFIQEGPAVIALHLAPGGVIPEHDAPHAIIFIVIQGSGFMRVGGGDAHTQEVQAGDAVLWPPHVPHTAWTTEQMMDVITVEYASIAPPDFG
jgi:quercetin dioxygenase-like cupin family protein